MPFGALLDNLVAVNAETVNEDTGRTNPLMSTERFSQWRPHPWHGLPLGDGAPEVVNAYVEITPFDLVKYEIDKATGYLRIDRPQRTSSLPPTLYGFIPRTYCGRRVADLSNEANRADEDPLDICVITEHPIGRPEMVVTARVAGVLRGLDGGRADDKIVAVLESDPLFGEIGRMSDLPPIIRQRLRHYFGTYKLVPGRDNPMSIVAEEGCDSALRIIEAASADYEEVIGQ